MIDITARARDGGRHAPAVGHFRDAGALFLVGSLVVGLS
jgi:hypothetical protein